MPDLDKADNSVDVVNESFAAEPDIVADDCNYEEYLLCERRSVFLLLMVVSGMMGAYTFNQRGGVFCNAQTANVLMMAVAFGLGEWRKGLYFIIPITAYTLGAFVSESLPSPIKYYWRLRWDTLLVGIEIIILFAMGFIPKTVPDRVAQVVINFVASMQYNTFRQAEGIPMSTTFCTNHVRQLGIAIAKVCRKHDMAASRRFMVHLQMICGFVCGAALLSCAGNCLQEKSIWLALVPLCAVFISLIHADIVTEKDTMSRKPRGH